MALRAALRRIHAAERALQSHRRSRREFELHGSCASAAGADGAVQRCVSSVAGAGQLRPFLAAARSGVATDEQMAGRETRNDVPRGLRNFLQPIHLPATFARDGEPAAVCVRGDVPGECHEQSDAGGRISIVGLVVEHGDEYGGDQSELQDRLRANLECQRGAATDEHDFARADVHGHEGNGSRSAVRDRGRRRISIRARAARPRPSPTRRASRTILQARIRSTTRCKCACRSAWRRD